MRGDIDPRTYLSLFWITALLEDSVQFQRGKSPTHAPLRPEANCSLGTSSCCREMGTIVRIVVMRVQY